MHQPSKSTPGTVAGVLQFALLTAILFYGIRGLQKGQRRVPLHPIANNTVAYSFLAVQDISLLYQENSSLRDYSPEFASQRWDKPKPPKTLFDLFDAVQYHPNDSHHDPEENVAGARRLLHRGANSNTSDKEGITPLMLACTHEWTATVKVLLAYGAKVNLKDKQGNTALIWAARIGAPSALVQALLSHGAKTNIKNAVGKTALTYAQEIQANDLVRLLKKASTKR